MPIRYCSAKIGFDASTSSSGLLLLAQPVTISVRNRNTPRRLCIDSDFPKARVMIISVALAVAHTAVYVALVGRRPSGRRQQVPVHAFQVTSLRSLASHHRSIRTPLAARQAAPVITARRLQSTHLARSENSIAERYSAAP